MRFRISDTGRGIDAQDLPRLFEKFQPPRQMADECGSMGTGLGLMISKRLVELHGGRIWVESQVGSGSTFSFTLSKYYVEEILKEYLNAGIRQAKQNQGALSIALVSIAGFDQLKARNGREGSAQLLHTVEELIEATVRQRGGDVVVRWQNGEVIVILPQTDKASCQAIAERILQTIEKHPYQVGDAQDRISVTISLITYPDEASNAEELLHVIEGRLRAAGQPKPCILVVDDESKFRRFVKEALELRGYEVLTAASGPDALEKLTTEHPDLILLDVMMPVMDGYQVYHLLKENHQTKDIPVLIVTAKGERTDRLLGMESFTYNYLSKPFQLDDLLAKIGGLLQQTAQR